MKKPRFKESQIFQVLKKAEADVAVPQLCRNHGMSNASFYEWRAKYGGLDVSSMRRIKELEEENARLKKMYAEKKLQAEIVAETLEKKVMKPSRREEMGTVGGDGQRCIDPSGPQGPAGPWESLRSVIVTKRSSTTTMP